MNRITRITDSRQNRVNIYVDGKPAFKLPARVAGEEGLHVGQELSAERVKALVESDSYNRCLDTAVRLLGYRPRSEAEMRQRLMRRGFGSDCVEKALSGLREQGYMDDNAFARFWKDNRESFSPRSRFLTGLELRKKGLSGEIIEQVVGEIDESSSAYRAASRKVERLSLSDYQVFCRRLGEYLRRRGFGYEVINSTVEKLWKEHGSGHV